MLELYRNIRARRKELRLTQEELAYKLGYTSRSSVAKIEAGAIDIPQSKITAFAVALETTPEKLMGMTGIRTLMDDVGGFLVPTVPRPLLGTIPCGDPVEAIQQSDETVDVPASIRCDFALRCRGDSMIGARIHDGDIVYIRIQPDVESGEIAAVMNGEGEATLKRVRKSAGVVTLWPENPDYAPIVYAGADAADLRIIGKAVGFTSLL